MMNLPTVTNLYETDFYQWTREQSQALRSQNLTQLDWENLIEEIEALGRSDYQAVVSLLIRMVQHQLKIDYAQRPECQRHWQAEIKAFANTLRRRYSPSMKPKLDVEWQGIYQDAVDLFCIDYPEPELPLQCLYGLTDFLPQNLAR